MLRMVSRIKGLQTWLRRGTPIPTVWRVYLYSHLLAVVFLAAALIPSIHLDTYFANLPAMADRLVGMLMWVAILSALIVPFVSIWILYLARKRGPSFTVLGVLDAVLCGLQWFVLYLACV